MTGLTEQLKNGKIEALEELINQIATVDDSRSFSDEYLKEKGLITREECGVAVEYPYGIVMVISDYVLPYLKKLQVIEEENKNLYKTLDVLNRHLDSFLKEEENQQLKELLKECKKELKPLWDEWLYDYGDKTGNSSARFLRIDDLLTRIDQVI